MKNLRKSIVLGGVALGLVGGALAYGAVSGGSASISIPLNKPAGTSVVSPATPARCAAGQETEHGRCVVRVEHSVISADAPINADAPTSEHANNGHPNNGHPNTDLDTSDDQGTSQGKDPREPGEQSTQAEGQSSGGHGAKASTPGGQQHTSDVD